VRPQILVAVIWYVKSVDMGASRPMILSMKDVRIRFGRRLRELRAKRKLSQEALSFEADLDRSYIGQVERGECNISVENMAKLARALKVKLSDLLRGV
jgi:ribosome-binding protein aMBF1 (putative translation factor)